jgi:hypothetical protein
MDFVNELPKIVLTEGEWIFRLPSLNVEAF